MEEEGVGNAAVRHRGAREEAVKEKWFVDAKTFNQPQARYRVVNILNCPFIHSLNHS